MYTHTLQEASSLFHVLRPHSPLSFGLDGVVLVDPELVKGKRGEAELLVLRGAVVWLREGGVCVQGGAGKLLHTHSLCQALSPTFPRTILGTRALFPPELSVRIFQMEVKTRGSHLSEVAG